MATNQSLPKPSCRRLRNKRFIEQNDWQLWDLSLSLSGNVAVSGGNSKTKHTFIDVYSVRSYELSNGPKLLYSKEFDNYISEGNSYCQRLVSFIEGSSDKLITCIGNKLIVIDVNESLEALRSCTMNGIAVCVSAKEVEVFIGFQSSHKISVYNTFTLNRIRSIFLDPMMKSAEHLQDMSVSKEKVWVCVSDTTKERSERFLCFGKNGTKVLKVNKNTSKDFHAPSLLSNDRIGVVAYLFSGKFGSGKRNAKVVFYSLTGELNPVFHIAYVKPGVTRIRLSDDGDQMCTGIKQTGEVMLYDMAELFTYNILKERLALMLQRADCLKIASIFNLSQSQVQTIESSDTPGKRLLPCLEERAIIEPHTLDKFERAVTSMDISSSCGSILDFYIKTRSPVFYTKAIKKENEDKKGTRSLIHEGEQVPESNYQQKVWRAEIERKRAIDQERRVKLQRVQLSEKEARDKLQGATYLRNKFAEDLELCRQEIADLRRDLQMLQITKEELKHDIMLLKQENSVMVAKRAQQTAQTGVLKDGSSQMKSSVSPITDVGHLPESQIEVDFENLLRRVSQRITLDDCLFLAKLFRFPDEVIDFLQHQSTESDTTGMKLFGKMKEHKMIHKYDVRNLRKCVEALQLGDVNKTLIAPYERQILQSEIAHNAWPMMNDFDLGESSFA